MSQTKEQILQQLRARWGELLGKSDGPTDDELKVDIELLTADGSSGQPLAYDIVQRNGSSTVTYTCVEMADDIEAMLALDNVTYDQAVETLRNLLWEARSLVGSDTADIPAQLTLTSMIEAEGLGMTYGRYQHSGRDSRGSFPTGYQAYFTTALLRNRQYDRSGVLFNQVTASLDPSGNFSLRFGN